MKIKDISRVDVQILREYVENLETHISKAERRTCPTSCRQSWKNQDCNRRPLPPYHFTSLPRYLPTSLHPYLPTSSPPFKLRPSPLLPTTFPSFFPHYFPPFLLSPSLPSLPHWHNQDARPGRTRFAALLTSAGAM